MANIPVNPGINMSLASSPSFSTLFNASDANSVKAALNKIAWEWFDAHQNDVVFNIRKWIFNFDIKVQMLEPVFELIFGAAQ